jgi:hypothetical protein
VICPRGDRAAASAFFHLTSAASFTTMKKGNRKHAFGVHCDCLRGFESAVHRLEETLSLVGITGVDDLPPSEQKSNGRETMLRSVKLSDSQQGRPQFLSPGVGNGALR